MKTFQIITDSSCDLPQELADKLELLVLPLHFTIGGKTYANYLDGREIGFHDFFERIRQGEAASTSAVNPESFREVMEQTLQQGLDILFVGFSSGLSTTYQSGCIAADDLREKYPERKILTVDSLCASLVGVLGIAIVASSSWCTLRVGASVMLAISTAGQIISSQLIDQFGLFGMPVQKFRAKQLPGYVLLAAGVALVVLGT